MQEYLWDEDSLGLDYVGATMTMDPSKSCMRDKAMSKFSPWLAHGCLSPRKLYEDGLRGKDFWKGWMAGWFRSKSQR